MTADILTKALPRDTHQRYVIGMGLLSDEDIWTSGRLWAGGQAEQVEQVEQVEPVEQEKASCYLLFLTSYISLFLYGLQYLFQPVCPLQRFYGGFYRDCKRVTLYRDLCIPKH